MTPSGGTRAQAPALRLRGWVLLLATALAGVALLGPAAAGERAPADAPPAFVAPVPSMPAALPAPAGADSAPAASQRLRVGVMTMQPGTVFFERFGHDSLVVEDRDTGTYTSYNFGFFDPSEPDFNARFARGDMQYYLIALPMAEDLAQYRDAGRGVSIQWLALDEAQAEGIAQALAVHARPENARYHYDYFTANCATQVRDMIDRALGGELQRQLAGRSRGNTYHSESNRLASPSLPMWLGFDLGFGPSADLPLSRWQEAFVPMRLAASLREVRLPDGRPLVASEETLLPHKIAPEPAESEPHWWPWLIAGLLLAAALTALARRAPRTLGALALAFWMLSTLLASLMLFIWFGGQHTAGWANRNLLLLSPLSILLWPAAIALLRGRRPPAYTVLVAYAVLAGAAVAWILLWLSVLPQQNQRWVALLLPVHAALAWGLHRRAVSGRATAGE